MAFDLIVNGRRHSVDTHPLRSLLDVLREELQLTGTKFGCGESQCGACSVLVEGKRVFSCQTPISIVSGKSIRTIEGLTDADGNLHPVQEAFISEKGFQCGYCTAGIIMTTVSLLEEDNNPSGVTIASRLNGNLCRCCSYPNILKAVRKASKLMKGDSL